MEQHTGYMVFDKFAAAQIPHYDSSFDCTARLAKNTFMSRQINKPIQVTETNDLWESESWASRYEVRKVTITVE